MQPTEDPAQDLARRLRALRQSRWRRKITQAELARVLERSEALISSWERATDPVTPPADRLVEYATFFCTARSVESEPHRVLRDEELTPAEIAERDRLRDELLALRDLIVSGGEPAGPRAGAAHSLVGRGPWRFAETFDDRPVVIVCPQLPDQVLDRMPHADASDLDYSELSRLTDLDALFELHGHIRAVNPDLRVEYRSVKNMRRDDSTGHLVVLGGVDWNPTQRAFMQRIDAPVVQRSEEDPLYRGCFQVVGDETLSFAPVIERVDSASVLVEDVGYFFRGPNPFNRRRTVTLCNGMFGRGVLGAVRALTDKQLRDSNAEYLTRTFGGADSYSILFRVPIIDERVVVTPDWTAPGSVLHTWSDRRK
jgi:transcriptional regulator with XRE-family HTH domain